MTPGKLIILGAVTWLILAVLTILLLYLYWPNKPPHAPLPTAGVPGCTEDSVRKVIVPAGATVAFSCPTHIEVSSMDEDRNTVLVWGGQR